MPADRENRESSPKNQGQSPTLDRDEIANRAYQFYMERGGAHGYDVEDWLHAEQELAGQKQQKALRPKLSKSEAA